MTRYWQPGAPHNSLAHDSKQRMFTLHCGGARIGAVSGPITRCTTYHGGLHIKRSDVTQHAYTPGWSRTGRRRRDRYGELRSRGAKLARYVEQQEQVDQEERKHQEPPVAVAASH